MVAAIKRARTIACYVLLCATAFAGVATRAEAQSRPTGSARGVDRVPGDFATLQQAVDLGRAPIILVASGEYAGATIDRPIAIACRGQCMITSGPAIGALQAGFVLEGGADGTLIHGFDFVDIDLGVFASCPTVGSTPDDVAIVRNAFVNTAQGVTVNATDCDGGAGWIVRRNRFHDLRSDTGDCGGGLGVYLIDVTGTEVSNNVFRGEIAAPPCGPLFTTAGIYLSGSSNVRVTRNDFELGDGGHAFKLDIALFADDGTNEDILVAFNDSRGSAAPFDGIHFLSVDGIDVRARCNSGTTVLEHTGSEGTSERYTENGCRRVSSP